MSYLTSKITTVVLSGLCIWLALLAVGSWVRHQTTAHDLVELQSQVAAAQRDNDQLSQQVMRMQQPQWLALLARERLNYKRPDENVVFVYKSNIPDTIVQTPAVPQQRAGWRAWLEWLGL